MAAPARSRFRFSLRGAMIAFVLLGLLFAYLGSYYRISRRGMEEAAEMEIKGFLYMPIQELETDKRMIKHYSLSAFYLPANLLDQAFTGAPGPVKCILWTLD
jgi:hypothetical protein